MAYLDHAATTPLLPEALDAMTAELRAVGNPSSLHASGRRARRVVEESREAIAAAVGARPGDVVLTGGGTEADNLAVKGLYWTRHAADPRRTRVLVSAVEHHAVLDPAAWLAGHEGAEVVVLPVDRDGRVLPETLRAAIAEAPEKVALVSVMWANNEIGTVQPIRALVDVAHEYAVPVHSDAVQALGQLPVDFAASGLDAMTITAHKIGGPVGVGALVVGDGTQPVALLHGGGQERDVRSGTLDAASSAGFAVAARIAVAEQPARAERLGRLRDTLLDGLRRSVPDVAVNGPLGTDRLPANAHVSFPGCEGDALLMLLDARGVECSTGSACSAGVPRPSHVLLALGLDESLARGSLRFSFGRTSTQADVEEALAAVPGAVERARRAGQSSANGQGGSSSRSPAVGVTQQPAGV